jgi:hypothetical protein
MSPGVRCFLRLPWPLARALLDLPAATQPIRVLPTTHVLNQPRSALIPRPSPHPDAHAHLPTHSTGNGGNHARPGRWRKGRVEA